MMPYEAFPNECTDTHEYAEKADGTYKIGAAVFLDGNEEIDECGADPAAIMGFALHDAGNHIMTGRCLVARANAGSTFFMSGTSSAAASDINVSYGIVKSGDIWLVDKTDTVNTRVKVLDVDLTRDLFHVQVLAANRQIQA